MEEKQTCTVAWVQNIFDPVASRQVREIEAGCTLGEVLHSFMPLAPQDFEIVACLNGQALECPRNDLVLMAGDSLAMTARPLGGGGGGGSNVLQAVAMIAVMVVAAVVTYGASTAVTTGAWAWGFGMAQGASAAGMIVGGAAGIATMAIGGALVSSVFKPNQPDFGSLGGMDALGASPTYSWQSQSNTLAEGTTLPILYGRFMITPPLIGRYVESVGTKQHLNLLYALCGHEIDAVERVIINDQESSTYKDIVLEPRFGTANQEVIPFFGDLKEENAFGIKLTTEWLQKTLSGSIQGFSITIGYRLYYANDQGGISTVSANINIEYRKKGETEWTKYIRKNTEPVTVTAKRWSLGCYPTWYEYTGREQQNRQLVRGQWREVQAGSENYADHKEGDTVYSGWYVDDYGENRRTYNTWRWISYEKIMAAGTVDYDYITVSSGDIDNHRITVYRDNVEEGEYEVRIKLQHELAVDSRHGSDVYFDSAHLIQYDDFTYPCTALLGIRALATDQLSSAQPTIKVVIRRDSVFVFDPIAKTYSKKAANNPAWACYDALHNGAQGHPDPANYGMGVPAERIVYADFYAWAQWCDAKKYTVNIYLDTAQTAKAVLDMLALMGRGMVIQIGSKFTCTVDQPVEVPRQRFLAGLGNIVSQTFSKSWLPLQDRANCIEITYFDENDDYSRQTVELYQDGFDSSDRIINRTSRTLYGCTKRADALRFGRGLMLRNRYLTYMPSFETSIESIQCLTGDIIALAEDDLRGAYSGRIVAAEPAAITLDREVELQPNIAYGIEIQDIDTDKTIYGYVVGVMTQSTTRVITLLQDLPSLPAAGSKYAFGEINRTTRNFRITNMATAQDQRKRLQLLEYVPEVYDDEVYEVPDEDFSADAFVRYLKLLELWQPSGSDGSGVSSISATWSGTALQWNVWLREQGGAWALHSKVMQPQALISGGLIQGKSYDVAISVGQPESGKSGSITIRGKAAPPADVALFNAVAVGNSIALSWQHVPDPDLWGYEIRMGTEWVTGSVIIDGVQENSAKWQPSMDGTYRFWIKALDDSGNYSLHAATTLVTIDINSVLNVVFEKDELPYTAGAIEYLTPLGSQLGWIPSLTDSDMPAGSTDQTLATYKGDYQQGIYTSPVYDLATKTPFTLRLLAEFTAYMETATDITYPMRTDSQYPNDTDVTVTSLSSYLPEYRLSDDGQAWGTWTRWAQPHDVVSRYFQTRFSAVTDADGVDYRFTKLYCMADVPEQYATKEISVATAGTTVTMQELGLRPMLLQYHVGATILGAAALYPAVEKAAQQFTVRCFDSAGNTHSAQVSLEIRGF